MGSTSKKVSGAIDWITGKLQRALGKLTGNRRQVAKGFGNQAKGAMKVEAGRAENAVNDLTR